MRRTFLLTVFAALGLGGWAQTEVSYTLGTTTLEQQLADAGISESAVKKLTLAGTWQSEDAWYIHENFANLEELDMSALTLAAVSSTENVTVANNEGTRSFQSAARYVPNGFCMGKTHLVTVKLPHSKSGGQNVTDIGHSSFANCTALTSIDLGDNGNFNSVGACAFFGCTSLESIDFSFMNRETNNGIGRSAFANCTSLASVAFPANASKGPQAIGDNCFNGCKALTSFTCPNSVRTIGQNAFGVCDNLASVTLPDNAYFTAIAPFAFTRCSKLTTISIPATVTSVGKGAFGASGLRSITVNSATPPTCDVSNAAQYPFLSIRNNIFVMNFAGEAIGHEADYRAADGWNYLMAKSLIEDDTQMAGQTNGTANWDFGTLAAGSGVRAYVQRTFTDGWNTLVLPFSASADVVKAALGSNVELATLDREEDGNLVFHTTDVITEGVPCIVRNITIPAGTTSMLFRGSFTDMENVYVFDGVDISKNNPTVTAQTKGNIVFNGTFKKQDVTLTKGYFLQNGNLFAAQSGETYKTKAFRAWFVDNSAGARALTFSVDGGLATSIEALDVQPEVNGSVYDLQGRRVSQPAKGLYIVNGKKVIF